MVKLTCGNPACGKEFERIKRNVKNDVIRHFCNIHCNIAYIKSNNEMQESIRDKKQANKDVKNAEYLRIFTNYSHLGYLGMAKMLNIGQSHVEKTYHKMIKEGHNLPKVARPIRVVTPVIVPVVKKKRVRNKNPKQRAIKPPKQAKQMVYQEKAPKVFNRPQPTKQDTPKPMRVAPPIAGVIGYVRIRVGIGTRGYDVITNDPVGCREKHEKRIAQNDPLSKFRKTA